MAEPTEAQKFRVIVADPPWAFSDKLTMSNVARGAEANYGTMTLEDIAALPVHEWSADAAVLAIWVPSSMLGDGMMVMQRWGFEQKQIYTWVKTSASGLAFGMGRYFRGCTEHALIGTRGKASKLVRGKSERNASMYKATPHSEKPGLLQDSLERMIPGGPYLEMFARRSRPGWVCVGNECPDTLGKDIRTWQP